MAGVAVYETSVYWATDTLNKLQDKYFPNAQESIQFHASPLRGNPNHHVEEPFEQLTPATRHELLDELYEVTHDVHGKFFAVIVEKAFLTGGEDPYERALEELLSRFDLYLSRMYRDHDQRNKGMVVIADSNYRTRLEVVARHFVAHGTRWRELHNILDIPFFTLARNSRLLQIADLVANTVYGRYESGHAGQFDRLLHKFDQDDGGPIHGLVHICRDRLRCYGACCWSRSP